MKLPATTISAPKVLSDHESLYKSYGIRLNKAMFIIALRPNSPAANAGFKTGDQIMQVGKKKVRTPKELQTSLSNYRLNHVLIERDNFQFFIRLRK